MITFIRNNFKTCFLLTVICAALYVQNTTAQNTCNDKTGIDNTLCASLGN